MKLLKKIIFPMLLLALCLWSCSPENKGNDDGANSQTDQTNDNQSDFIELPSQNTELILDDEIAEIVLSHTGGVVSRTQAIEINFIEPLPQAWSVGETLSSDFIRINPRIDGSLILGENQQLIYKTDEGFKEGTEYKVTLFLSEIFPSKSDINNLEFQFRTIQQDFEVNIDPVKIEADETAVISGNIITSDYTEDALIERLFSYARSIDSNNLQWVHNENIHSFIIPDIPQKDDYYEILIQWDGNVIGVNKKGEQSVQIPGQSAFELLNHLVISEGNSNYLKLYFSNPVDPNQNLDGLIGLNNSDTNTSIEGSTIKVFPPNNNTGLVNVHIENSIKNISGQPLSDKYDISTAFYALKPEVRFTENSGIYTGGSNFSLPFEAVSLQAVDIQIIRVFDNNMLRFYQFNKSLAQTNSLKMVARPVYQGPIELDPSGEMNLYEWNRFSIDISKYVEESPNSVYVVYVDFRRSQSLYPGAIHEGETWELVDSYESQSWDELPSSNSYYYYPWNDRNNPAKEAYYAQNHRAAMTFLTTDLGMIVKSSKNNRIDVAISSLETTEPISDAGIKVYNYQLQEIGSGKTDGQGLESIDCLGIPFIVTVEKGDYSNYLRVDSASAISMSNFNIQGVDSTGGIKGFIYGERGVWRPGDPIYLTFILEDKDDTLPSTLPVVMEFLNPSGQMMDRQVNSSSPMGMYRFTLNTEEQAQTGTWTARFRVGDRVFERAIPVETVKPNRLKVEFNPAVEIFTRENAGSNGKYEASIFSEWLHGAPARNLKAEVDLSLISRSTSFEDFPGFRFDDDTNNFSEPRKSIFDGRLDEEGNKNISFAIETNRHSRLPGSLYAVFSTRVYEEGGNFSTNQVIFPYYSYSSYVGIQAPPGNSRRGRLTGDTDHQVQIATVNVEGEALSLDDVSVKLYKLSWRWWWDRSRDESLANYVSRSGVTPLQADSIDTQNGRGTWTLRVAYPEWGRFLVVVEDPKSGHQCSQVVYIDWPGYISGPQTSGGSASFLSTFTDKEEYLVGETVELTIPSSEGGRALISLEKGDEVLDSYWVETQQDTTVERFTVTEEMCPTLYIDVTLIQPAENKSNDSPIRLFGVTPIAVKDPATILTPEIAMDETLKPESSFSVTVSEKSGKAMAYTIAVVDDGLLDITNFATPDPWKYFFSREALSVRTWDQYNLVMGKMTGDLGSILAPGGSDFLEDNSEADQNRFRPVVIYQGPFILNSGESRTHVLNMPQYVGSVRTMVIASNGSGAYGMAEKTTRVKQELMIQGTLPRIAGTNEVIDFPVTIFGKQGERTPVSIQLETSDGLYVEGSSTVDLTIDTHGEITYYYRLKTGSSVDPVRVEVTATSATAESRWSTPLELRYPNEITTRSEQYFLNSDSTETFNIEFFGIPGTNSGSLEITTLPPINLRRHYRWLIRYPHGCIEQTTSSVFPQLFLADIMELTEQEKKEIQTNVSAAISRLATFQLPSGGLSYWPGGTEETQWGTNYAGHFLLEAKRLGYNVPGEMLNKLLAWEIDMANRWDGDSQLTQAYRLYLLALGGKGQSGAMNRLRETGNLDTSARWRLAAAYALDGKERVAQDLISGAGWEIEDYRSTSSTYGSSFRDKAMILETMTILNNPSAANLLKEISDRLSSSRYFSTQELSYSLIAVSKYANNQDLESLEVSYSIDGGSEERLSTQTKFLIVDLLEGQEQISISNQSGAKLYLSLTSTGVPRPGEERAEQSRLSMTVKYQDREGRTVDPSSLTAGTDFMMIVTVDNDSNEHEQNIALSTIFPAGWEILNTRMDQSGQDTSFDQPDYQDFRDDRIYSYFDFGWGNHSKTFAFYLTAAYSGEYYFPGIRCESMYNMDSYSLKKGMTVEVIADR